MGLNSLIVSSNDIFFVGSGSFNPTVSQRHSSLTHTPQSNELEVLSFAASLSGELLFEADVDKLWYAETLVNTGGESADGAGDICCTE